MTKLAVIVEDDDRIVEMVRDMVVSSGMTAVEFYTTSAVVEALDKLPDVDLFILDRGLPETAGSSADSAAGDALLRHVAERYPNSTIIVFTGFAGIEHKRLVRSLQHPGVAVVEKDDALELRDAIRAVANS